jgi:hypothetical protein
VTDCDSTSDASAKKSYEMQSLFNRRSKKKKLTIDQNDCAVIFFFIIELLPNDPSSIIFNEENIAYHFWVSHMDPLT